MGYSKLIWVTVYVYAYLFLSETGLVTAICVMKRYSHRALYAYTKILVYSYPDSNNSIIYMHTQSEIFDLPWMRVGGILSHPQITLFKYWPNVFSTGGMFALFMSNWGWVISNHILRLVCWLCLASWSVGHIGHAQTTSSKTHVINKYQWFLQGCILSPVFE